VNVVKKLAGQSAVYGLSSIIGRFLNYLLVPLHTNIFVQPGQYGVVTEFYAYISFLMILYTYGMETSFFQFSRQENSGKKVFGTIMSSILGTTAAVTFGVLFFSDRIAELIMYPGHAEYVQIMAIVLALAALTAIPFAKLRQQSKAKRFALLKIINISVNILFNLFFFIALPYLANISSSYSEFFNLIYYPDNMVVYVFVANLIASLITFLLMLKEFRFSLGDFDPLLLKKIILYSLPLLVAGFAGMINETLDRVMIKYLVSEPEDAMAQLGIYGACYKLSILMTLFIQAFKYAAEPFFFSQYGKDDAKESYSVVMKYFVLTCSFIFLFIMMYIDVFKYFIGPSYRSGLHIVPILLLANMCLGIFFNLSMWYKLTGETRYGAYFAIIGAAITIAGNIYLIPMIGYSGAAWTTLICYASIMILSYVVGARKFPVKYRPLKLAGYIGLAVLFFLTSEWLTELLSLNFTFKMIMNTILLLLYVGVVFQFDKLKELR
jgi:O-antigen/teichoic acid export membrane protein